MMIIESFINLLFVLGILYLLFGRRKPAKTWLPKEANKWVEKKIISQDQASKILDSYPKNKICVNKKERYTKMILVIGALFIGVGALLFVSSNWAYLSPWSRFFVVVSFIVLLNLVGYYFYFIRGKQQKILGMVLCFSGAMSFGAAIFLVAQIFHLSSHYPSALLLWFVGTLPFLFVFKNKLFFIFSFILSISWLIAETEFYSFLFEDPSKYIFFTIFLFFSIIFVLTIIFEKPMKNLFLQSIRSLSILGVLVSAVVSKWFFVKEGFLSSSLPIHVNVMCILSLLLIIYLILKNKDKQVLKQLIWLIVSTISLFSIFYYPEIWNEWIYLFVFEFIALLGIFSFRELWDSKGLNQFLLFMIWLTYSISSVIVILEQDEIGVVAILFVLLWSLNTYFLSMIVPKERKTLFAISGIAGLFLSVFLLTFDDVIIDAAKKEMFMPISKHLIRTLMPSVAIFYLLFKKKILQNISSFMHMTWLLAIILMIITFLIFPAPGVKEVIIFAWNILFLVLIFTMMYIGFQKEKSYMINLSLIVFTIWLIFRYFDLFWGLLDRSIFFIGGGFILLICGIMFQRKNNLLKKPTKKS